MHRKPAAAKTSKIAESSFNFPPWLFEQPSRVSLTLSSLRSFAGLCFLTPSAGAPVCR